MSAADEATAEHPRRRRTPWSLKSIVVDVTGKPITEFQEAPRSLPAHRLAPDPGHAEIDSVAFAEVDPVDRVSPPLSGPNARRYHGPSSEQHAETIGRHRTAGDDSPSNRPERIYLHYLLLHIDRLSLTSLWYLRRQVNEEIAHRARAKPSDAELAPAAR